jgi:hypothetical protein
LQSLRIRPREFYGRLTFSHEFRFSQVMELWIRDQVVVERPLSCFSIRECSADYANVIAIAAGVDSTKRADPGSQYRRIVYSQKASWCALSVVTSKFAENTEFVTAAV